MVNTSTPKAKITRFMLVKLFGGGHLITFKWAGCSGLKIIIPKLRAALHAYI